MRLLPTDASVPSLPRRTLARIVTGGLVCALLVLAVALTVASAADMSGFEPIKSSLSSLPGARTMAEVEKGGAGSGGEANQSVGTPGQPVPAPSTELRQISGGKIFQASVPSNWTPLNSNSSIKVVPQNGYGELKGQMVFS